MILGLKGVDRGGYTSAIGQILVSGLRRFKLGILKYMSYLAGDTKMMFHCNCRRYCDNQRGSQELLFQ